MLFAARRLIRALGVCMVQSRIYCPKPLVKAMHFQCKTFSCYTLLEMLEVRQHEREQIWRSYRHETNSTSDLGNQVSLSCADR